MNRYIVTDEQLAAYERHEIHLPERAHTARMIIVPSQVILINTAAAPGCNVDRVFYRMEEWLDFIGDRVLYAHR